MKRAGFTLIELLIVITATAMLSVTGATLICVLMAAEGAGAESLVIETALSNLSRRLRDDLHAAQSVDVSTVEEAGGALLDVHIADNRRVRYACTAAGVARQVFTGETASQQDVFRFPAGRSRFEHSDDRSRIVFIHVRPHDRLLRTGADHLQATPLRETRVEAVIGWDHCFAESIGGPSP